MGHVMLVTCPKKKMLKRTAREQSGVLYEEAVDAADRVGGMVLANMAAIMGEELVKDDVSTSAINIHITVHSSIFLRCHRAVSKNFIFYIKYFSYHMHNLPFMLITNFLEIS